MVAGIGWALEWGVIPRSPYQFPSIEMASNASGSWSCGAWHGSSDLAPSVQRYFRTGLAPSTHKTYGAAMKRFHNFCVTYSVNDPFPVTEQLLCCFAASLADHGLAPPNCEVVPVRSTQQANITGPTRPKRAAMRGCCVGHRHGYDSQCPRQSSTRSEQHWALRMGDLYHGLLRVLLPG